MSDYEAALQIFYDGEVLGEAAYSALLAAATTAEERQKWSTLLQFETETKAWLRPPMIAAGVSIVEREEKRREGEALAARLRTVSWQEKMAAFERRIGRNIERNQGFADAARARGRLDEEAVCLHMVEHSRAGCAFARRELAGTDMAQALELVTKVLKYPLNR